MLKEIERKFLVNNDGWRQEVESSIHISQAYIRTAFGRVTIRVRIAGDCAWLTLKGPSSGISRDEYEYEIPVEEANKIISTLCDTNVISKTRHIVLHDGRLWEVDEYDDLNTGLIVAELEVSSESDSFNTPPWLGEEVSQDRRYSNASLAVAPYSEWKLT